MKRILSLITVVTLLFLIALPGLAAFTCTDKEGIAAVRELFLSDGITRDDLENSASARESFAQVVGFCLYQEGVSACDPDSFVLSIYRGNVYVCLEPDNVLALLMIFNGDEVIIFSCDLYGLGLCNYYIASIDDSLTNEYYMSITKSKGTITQYWPVSFSE